MKSAEETKKGLECCAAHDCNGCGYNCGASTCIDSLLKDISSLIQQLQYDNAQLNRCIENMTDKLNAMNDEAAKLQAERDAAVESMRSDPHCCYHCANMTKRGICQSEPRADGHCFEWRGVQKEE